MDKKERVEVVKLISQVVNSLSEKEEGIPISIFRTKGISGLEAIVVYLKDHQKKSIKEIATSLKREASTIYTTYTNAQEKLKKIKGKLNCSDNPKTVPLKIFSQRKYSILESLAFYLQDKENYSLKQIANLINKNYNTVKTVLRRYRKKNNGKK